jgi:hypothetical protein
MSAIIILVQIALLLVPIPLFPVFNLQSDEKHIYLHKIKKTVQ